MRVAFRCDDIGVGTDTRFFDVEKQIIELFVDKGVPLIIGVVPMMTQNFFDPENDHFVSLDEDPRRMQMVREAVDNGIQIGVHGLHHQVARPEIKTEFAGVPEAEQSEKMREAIALLNGWFPDAPVDVFIPPWNSYDKTTVTAVGESGMTHLSAGDDSRTYDQNGVTVSASIPIGTFFEMLEVLTVDQLARQVGGGCLVVTFHAYQHVESHPNFEMTVDELGHKLEELQAAGVQLVGFDRGVEAKAIKPRSRLLGLRVAAFIKTYRLGRASVLDVARSVKSRFGVAPARMVVDAAACSLFWLPLFRAVRRR